MFPPTTPKILVIGSLNADLITTTPRLPLAGETLTSTSFTTAPGGKGANQAVACSRLSLPSSTKNVRMHGAVGSDSFAPLLLSALTDSNVDVSSIATVPGPTGTAIIIVETGGENRILLHPGANAGVVGLGESVFSDAAAVVLQLEVPVATVLWALEKAHKRGLVTVFNPAPAVPLPEECFPWVDWLVVNETEAAILAGVDVSMLDSKAGVEATARKLLGKGVRAVVVTLGGRGCYWTADGSGEWHAATVRREEVVDTTGAGDTFVGALTVAAVEGKSIAEAVAWASKAAGAAVKKAGAMAGVPWRHEVDV